MNKDTLQGLVTVHNLLYGMTVTGDAVIPMAQAITILEGIIKKNAASMDADAHAETEEVPNE